MNNLDSNSLLTKKDPLFDLNDFLEEFKNNSILKQSLQSNASFFHKVLIACAQKLGYPAMSDGMCHGFTMRWIEAVLSNSTNFFIKRTAAIAILDSLLNSTNDPRILEKIKAKPGFLNIKAFYDSAMLYQYSDLSSEILNKPLFFQNNEEISVFASSDLIRQVGGFKQTKPIVYNNFTLSEVKATLEELEGKIKDSGYKLPVVFLMIFTNPQYQMHAASIIYIPGQRTWFFMDVNYFPPKAAAKLDTFVNQLPYNYYQDFSLTAILPHQNTESLLAEIGQICPIKPNLKNKSHILHLMTSHNHFDEVVEKLIKDTIFLPNEKIPLFLAAQHGHLEIVQALLLKDGIDINQAGIQGATPLFMASQNGHLEIVEALLFKDGIDSNRPSDQGITPLSIASQKGHLEIVQALILKDGININHSNDQGFTALSIASLNGHLEIIQALLLKEEIAINYPTAKGSTALYLASQNGHLEIVQALLQKDGIDINCPNDQGFTPLSIASQCGHLEIVQALLQKDGIDINYPGKQGVTPLFIASEKGHLEIIQAFLLKDGIDINRPNDEGFTPLSIASQKGHLEVVQALLLKDGIDINRPCNQDATPLFMASQNGHLEIVERLLLQDRIDINRPCDPGITPLWIASKNGHLEIVKFLLNHPRIDISKSFQTDANSLRIIINHLAPNNPEAIRRMTVHIQNHEEKNLKKTRTTKIDITPADIAHILGHTAIFKALSEYLFINESSHASASKRSKTSFNP